MFASANDGGTALQDRTDKEPAKPKRPTQHNVILHDDEDHSFAFVMEMLQELFNYDAGQAYTLTEEVVEEGKAIVYTASCLDEAKLKKDQITSYGRDRRNRDCLGAMGVTIESL